MKIDENNGLIYLNKISSFRPLLEGYLNEKNELGENATLCGALMELSFFYEDLEKNKDDNLETIKEIFNVAEKLATEGDDDVQGFLEVCFLESLINYFGHGPESKLKDFLNLLGPASIELCKKNDAFWGTKTKGLYDL